MTKHKSQNLLVEELVRAEQQVPKGSLWTHYKNPDLQYKIVDHAILEATDEIAVLYQAQYGEKLTFIRPLSGFVEMVTKDDKQLARFTLV